MDFSAEQFKELIDKSDCMKSGVLKVYDNFNQISAFDMPLLATADNLFEFKYFVFKGHSNIKIILLGTEEKIESNNLEKMGYLCKDAIANIQNKLDKEL